MAHNASSVLDRLDSSLLLQNAMAAAARRIKQEVIELEMEHAQGSNLFEDYEHVDMVGATRNDHSGIGNCLRNAPTTPRAMRKVEEMRYALDAPSAPRIMREAEEFLERTQTPGRAKRNADGSARTWQELGPIHTAQEIQPVQRKVTKTEKQAASKAKKKVEAAEAAQIAEYEADLAMKRALKAERRAKEEANISAKNATAKRKAIEALLGTMVEGDEGQHALRIAKIAALKEEIKARETAVNTSRNGWKKLQNAQQALEKALQENLDRPLMPNPPEVVFGAQKAAELQKINEEHARSKGMEAINADHNSDYDGDLLAVSKETGVHAERIDLLYGGIDSAKRIADEAYLSNEVAESKTAAKRRRKEKKAALKSTSDVPKKSKKSDKSKTKPEEAFLVNDHNDDEAIPKHNIQQIQNDEILRGGSPPKQLKSLRQLVQNPILPAQKQQASYGSSAGPQHMRSPAAPILPQVDPNSMEQTFQDMLDQPGDTGDPYGWMSSSLKDSFLATVNHVRSTIRETSSDSSIVPDKQFSWLPSAQKDSLLDTIRNSKTDSPAGVKKTVQVVTVPKAPKARVSFDLTPQPKLFSSTSYRRTPYHEVTLHTTSDIDSRSSEDVRGSEPSKSTVILPTSVPDISTTGPKFIPTNGVSGSASPTILPPARDYVVHGTPQSVVQSPAAKTTLLPPNPISLQHTVPIDNTRKPSAILPSLLPQSSSTSKITKALKATNDSPILPPQFHRHLPIPNGISQPTVDSRPPPILPPTPAIEKLHTSSASKRTPIATKDHKKHSKKRSYTEEELNEETPEINHKRQKRAITAAGSPSPIPAPIIPRRKSDPPAPKRVVDLMLTQQDEWEVTGGRFRGRVNLSEDQNDDAEVEENIAFSSLYIQNRPKPIAIANLKFHILRLASGESTDLTGEKGIKVCSVARGRVKVNIAGKRFSIGENGMWRVRGGEKCNVHNQISEEAVVHVSDVN